MVRGIWHVYKWWIIGTCTLVYALVFIILDALWMPAPAHAASSEDVARLEKIVRERLGKAEGTVSITLCFIDDRPLRITFGTIPHSSQSILTIEYDIHHRIHEIDEDDLRADASTRITVNRISAVYIDIDKDGRLDLSLDTSPFDSRGMEEITAIDGDQFDFDLIITESIVFLTDGLPS